MTRSKDRTKQKQESVRKTRNLHKCRVFQKQEEIAKEIQLLQKIQEFPPELIRMIYSYMSGNAKLICNFKFDFLEKMYNKYDIYCTLTIIEELSKKECLDLIRKGVLHKFSDIIDSVDGFYHCLDNHECGYVNGHRLFNLWETNRLQPVSINPISIQEDYKDWNIKYNMLSVIQNYITHIIESFNKNKARINSQKNWIITENTLFLNLDKAFYLFKCFEKLHLCSSLIRNKIV